MSVTMDSCPACHSLVGPQDAYCQRCGKRLSGSGGTSPSAPAAPPSDSSAGPGAFASSAVPSGPTVDPRSPAGPTPVPLRDLGTLSPALAGAGAAPVGTRVGAGLLDGLVNVVAALVLYGAEFSSRAVVPIFMVYLVVLVLFWRWNATTGLTVGRLATGLRLVSVDTGGAPGWGRTAGRSLIAASFGTFTCGLLSWLPAASILWDRDDRSRGWHDKWSRTVVIDTNKGRDTLAAAVPARSAAPRPVLGAVSPASAVPAAWSAATPPAPPAPPAHPAPVAPELAQTWSAPSTSAPRFAAPPPPPPPPPARVEAPVPPAPDVAPAATGGVISAVPGVAEAVHAAPPAVAATAEPAPALSFRPGRVGAPPPDATVDDADRTVMRPPRRPSAVTLAFDTGERVSLTGGLGLVGRDPQARPDEHVDHLVPIEDPERSVSKTHLSFGVDGAGFWVCDRGSTNGVRVVRGDAVIAEVGQDEPTYVAVDDVVEFGDRRFVVQKD